MYQSSFARQMTKIVQVCRVGTRQVVGTYKRMYLIYGANMQVLVHTAYYLVPLPVQLHTYQPVATRFSLVTTQYLQQYLQVKRKISTYVGTYGTVMCYVRRTSRRTKRCALSIFVRTVRQMKITLAIANTYVCTYLVRIKAYLLQSAAILKFSIIFFHRKGTSTIIDQVIIDACNMVNGEHASKTCQKYEHNREESKSERTISVNIVSQLSTHAYRTTNMGDTTIRTWKKKKKK